MPQLIQPGSGESRWIVACLCAAWCDTCRDYQVALKRLAEHHAAEAFVWVDIEDDSDWVGDLDIENFPTLLISRDGDPHFFGTVLPHIEQLAMLVASVKANDAALRAPEEDLQQLAARIRAEILEQT